MQPQQPPTEWYLVRDGKQHGPISASEFRALVKEGHLHPRDLVWRAGFHQWLEASTVPGLIEPPQTVPIATPSNGYLGSQSPQVASAREVLQGDTQFATPGNGYSGGLSPRIAAAREGLQARLQSATVSSLAVAPPQVLRADTESDTANLPTTAVANKEVADVPAPVAGVQAGQKEPRIEPVRARRRGAIFINYRKSDSAGWATMLCERLSRDFRREQIFFDAHSIAPGVDFTKALEKQMADCDAFICVIGPEWLAATDKTGRRRLDSPDDYVRIEIESALKREIRFIPVLVNGARLPAEEQLPDSLKPLVRRQAHPLPPESYGPASTVLVEALKRELKTLGRDRSGVVGDLLGRVQETLPLISEGVASVATRAAGAVSRAREAASPAAPSADVVPTDRLARELAALSAATPSPAPAPAPAPLKAEPKATVPAPVAAPAKSRGSTLLRIVMWIAVVAVIFVFMRKR